MGNFRRKKIIETLLSQKMSSQQKNLVLDSYDDYIRHFYGDCNSYKELDKDQKFLLKEQLYKTDDQDVQQDIRAKLSEHPAAPALLKMKQKFTEQPRHEVVSEEDELTFDEQIEEEVRQLAASLEMGLQAPGRQQ